MRKPIGFVLLATVAILCGTSNDDTRGDEHWAERTPDLGQLRKEFEFEVGQPYVFVTGGGGVCLEIPVSIVSQDLSIKWVNWKHSEQNIDLWLVLEPAGKTETKPRRAIVGIGDLNRQYSIRYLNPDGSVVNLKTVVPEQLEKRSAEQ